MNKHNPKELDESDYIAFKFNWNGEQDEIMVSKITSKTQGGYIVHFLYGHHSLSEIVKHEEVLAIGSMDGTAGIKGWTGKFHLIQPDNELLKQNLK